VVRHCCPVRAPVTGIAWCSASKWSATGLDDAVRGSVLAVDVESEVLAAAGGEPVVLTTYDECRQERFAAWHDRLASALGQVALSIEHVGSTAVPGLIAKPVIDIQVSVADVADESSYRAAIEGLGLILRSRERGHRFFRHDVGALRTVHVHVCSRGSQWERDHLLFRDYLRRHPDRRDAYAALKRELAARVGADRLSYTNAKTLFVIETLAQAESSP